MTIKYKCAGIRGEKIEGTIAHEYNAEKSTVSMEVANIDFHFTPVFEMMQEKSGNSVMKQALYNLSDKDYYSGGFIYTTEECITNLDKIVKTNLPNEVVEFPSAYIDAVLNVENELLRTVLFSGDIEERKQLKPVVKNLTVDGNSAIDLLSGTKMKFNQNSKDMYAHFGAQHPYHRDFDFE